MVDVERLPDDHPSKPWCSYRLAQLLGSIGNHLEPKRFLNSAPKLWREQGGDKWVAPTLRELSDANRILGLYREGIHHTNDALEICRQLGDTGEHAQCLCDPARLLYEDRQLDAAKEAAVHVVDLLLEKGKESRICESYRVLGHIYRSKGEREKTVRYYGLALGLASPFEWPTQLFWINYSLAELFSDEGEFEDVHVHIERARSHTSDHSTCCVIELQARIWYQ